MSFQLNILSKPNKYCIKCFALVDEKMKYTYNIEIYADSQLEGSFNMSGERHAVVNRSFKEVLED